MVRPAQFGFNHETAATNIFQKSIDIQAAALHEKALKEFDDFVQLLRSYKIYVIVLQDPGKPPTPDAVFPNNWISFHHDTMVLYPMLAVNRRQERRKAWVRLLQDAFTIGNTIDLSDFENQNQFLEGTGSLVLDRKNSIAYANRSSRTHDTVLKRFAEKLNYKPLYFTALDREGNEIYHTNVLLSIGTKTAVICSEIISDNAERNAVLRQLSAHHEIVTISYDQMLRFSGNILLVKNRDGANFWVMSDQAMQAFDKHQLSTLLKDGHLIHAPLTTIETAGGGSARCMLAEIFYEG